MSWAKFNRIGRLLKPQVLKNSKRSPFVSIWSRAQLYLKGSANNVYEPWLKSSAPFKAENIAIMQLIDNSENLSVFDLGRNFLEFSLTIIFSYLVTLLALGLFCLFLSQFHRRNVSGSPMITKKRRNKQWQKWRGFEAKVNRFLSFLMKNDLPSFQLLSLFMGMFFWQSLLFVTNSIKTNKVMLGEWLNWRSESVPQC